MRQARRDMVAGKKRGSYSLNKDRIADLDAIGFDWQSHNTWTKKSNPIVPNSQLAQALTSTSDESFKTHRERKKLTTIGSPLRPRQMATLQHSNDGGGKMKVMSSNKTVRLLQEDLIKEMSRGDGEGVRTEVIMDILQRLNEVDINLKILSETIIGATVMKLKKDDGVAITVSNAARKLIKKWKSIAEKAEANTTAKMDVTIKSTTTSEVMNCLKVAKQGALTSQDLSSSSTTHKTIAAKMISLLPDGATRQDAAGKRMVHGLTIDSPSLYPVQQLSTTDRAPINSHALSVAATKEIVDLYSSSPESTERDETSTASPDLIVLKAELKLAVCKRKEAELLVTLAQIGAKDKKAPTKKRAFDNYLTSQRSDGESNRIKVEKEVKVKIEEEFWY